AGGHLLGDARRPVRAAGHLARQAGAARLDARTRRGLFVSTPALEALRVCKNFGGVKAVDDVSFAVAPGSLSALIGPNGAGKTTVFNMVTNLFPPSSGEVHFFGKNLAG